MENATKASTWNINGRLTIKEEREHIFLDARERKLHFMCLQETGCKIHQEFMGKGGIIINLAGQSDEYRGLAFYISNGWSERIINVKLINDRIAVIRYDLEEKGQLTVINVYGPTSVNTAREPELGRAFYSQVQAVYSAEKVKSALVFIMGDFNSKIGMQEPTDSDFMWEDTEKDTEGKMEMEVA